MTVKSALNSTIAGSHPSWDSVSKATGQIHCRLAFHVAEFLANPTAFWRMRRRKAMTLVRNAIGSPGIPRYSYR
jgi:hypothetical protein